MKLSNRVYNAAKWVVTIALPAAGALYIGLAQVWDFQNSVAVVGTINSIAAFLGVLIGYSSKQYAKSEAVKAETEAAPDGDLIVNEVDGEKYTALGVNGSLDALLSKDAVRLTVVDNTQAPTEE